jgi:hypothetical protein
MILEVDTKFLLDYSISAHQYLLLKLAYEGDYDHMKDYLKYTKTYDDLPKDMTQLYNAGFISSFFDSKATFRGIIPTAKFKEKAIYTGDPFDEFYDIFPTKVLRPDGNYDYLRTDRQRCRKIYHNIIKVNKTMHDYIMSCLKIEVDVRSRTGKMAFMKRMPTWLSSEEWKVYEDRLTTARTSSASASVQEGVGYGTEIDE